MFSAKSAKPKKNLKVILLLSLMAPSYAAAMDPSLEKLFGAVPKKFAATYLAGAKKLKTAIQKKDSKTLQSLTANSQWQDYALWELAKLQRERKQFRYARKNLLVLLDDHPNSALEDRAKELLPDLEIAIADSSSAEDALRFYRRAFTRLSRKRWAEYEKSLRHWLALYESKDALLKEAFQIELLDTLPSDNALHKELVKKLGTAVAVRLQKLPRTRSVLGSSSIKPIYPDQQWIEEGMALVLQSNWNDALTKFQAFPTTFADSEQLDRALYWEAECLAQIGQESASQAKYQELWQRFPLGYYGLQAGLRLKKNLTELFSSEIVEAKPIEGPLVTPQAESLWRLRALLATTQESLARIEAEHLFNLRPAGTTLGQDMAANSLGLAKIYFASTYYLGSFTHFFSAFLANKNIVHPETLRLVFPQVYTEPIAAAASATGLDPVVVLSLTKQESAFLPDVTSRSDAMGLMQLILPTAKEMELSVTREKLFDAEKNTQLGAAYLRKLIDRYDGNLALALAAYNAGPHRASQWQKKLLESPLMQKSFRVDAFIDSIPFTETRRYVATVLRNIAWYKILASQPLPTTVQELAGQWKMAVQTVEGTP